jgi:hypothetical protein
MKITPDELRKAGEAGRMTNEVSCLDGFSGFHHPWIGYANLIINKSNAFARTEF